MKTNTIRDLTLLLNQNSQHISHKSRDLAIDLLERLETAQDFGTNDGMLFAFQSWDMPAPKMQFIHFSTGVTWDVSEHLRVHPTDVTKARLNGKPPTEIAIIDAGTLIFWARLSEYGDWKVSR